MKTLKKTLKYRPLITLIALSIILILGPMFLLRKKRTSSAVWYDDKFYYWTAITITNSGAAVSNQKVKLDIATDSLYSAVKIQINCNDSRFTDANG